jgi:hypothetical protein
MGFAYSYNPGLPQYKNTNILDLNTTVHEDLIMVEDDGTFKDFDSFLKFVETEIPKIVGAFEEKEENRAKRTLSIPTTFDEVFRQVITGKLLQKHVEISYSDLVVGFALIGLVKMASDDIKEKICDELDFIHGFDKVEKILVSNQ